MKQAANVQQNIQPILGGTLTRAERERLMRVAAAAYLLVQELDQEVLASFKHGDELVDCFVRLHEDTLQESLGLLR
jgi:hypothetical protein